VSVTAAGRRSRFVGARIDRLSDGQFAAISLLPGLILVILIVVPPVAAVFGLSFFRVELLKDDLRPFVGLHNFIDRMPVDTDFLASLPRTAIFAFVSTLLAVPVALGAALLVNSRGRSAAVLGLLLLLPWAVAPVADGVFWRMVFDTNYGLVNDALGVVGIGPLPWNTDDLGELVVTLAAVVWRSTPLLAVLLFAALRAVPPSLGRAARMDGASSWQAFRFATLPAIRPTLIVVCVVQIVLSLQVFDILFAITRAQPKTGAILTGFSIYDSVINNLSFGYGAAQTVVLALLIGVCLLPVLVLVWRPRRRRRGTDGLPVADGPDLNVRADILLTGGTDAAVGTGSLPLDVNALRPTASSIPPEAAPPERRPSAFRPGERAGRVARLIVSAIVIVWLAGPIVWLGISSVEPESALKSVPPALTTHFTLDGYTRLLNDPSWSGALAISVAVAVGATALAILAAILVGYPLARIRFRGSQLFLALLLITQLVPPIALAIPVLLLFVATGLKGTVPGLILVNAAFWTPILAWLVRNAFLSVPISIERAGRMDGLGRVGTIVRVALPAAAPAIAAAAVIVFIGVWNDFVFAVTIGTRTTQTLPRYLTVTSDPPYHVLAAGILLTIAPCLILIALLHGRILRAV
jgi:multiple sugar transport system permease protein